MAVKPGDILGRKYRVDALIGRGGMGHVFAATDLEAPSVPVAVKVVSRVLFDETLMARLHREAEAAARIRSEYVPRVLEVASTDEREVFLVMERLVGESLSQRMRDKGPLPWGEVVQIGEDILRGLIDAHTAGVVHRDLKPSNVFLARREERVRAMVLDFGVCKMDTVDTQHLTATGESIGTVAYMAPEQIRGASKVDDRADLYAFGVLVFEMVCGRLPHDGPSQMAILASKLENEPGRLRDCSRTPTPVGLDALVAKALIREPEARFTSAQELLKAWRKLGPADVARAPSMPLIEEAGPLLSHGAAAREAALGGLHHENTARGTTSSISHEAHRTHTALTAGLSLKAGGSGRAALLAVAFALAAGVICVVAFFARGPDRPNAAASGAGLVESPPALPPVEADAAASLGAVSTPETREPSLDPPARDTIEMDDEPVVAESVAPPRATKVETRRSSPRVRASRPPPPPPTPAPKPSSPHITVQPRY